MKSNYKKLGSYIRTVDERNTDLAITNLQGVSITKEFVPSIANIIGTDLSTYKIVRTGQFAYGPVTSRNGDKVSIALLKDEDCIISSSYVPFEVYITFSGLTLLQLSEFYVITVANGDKSISRVLMIPTEGIPEDREKAVVTDVVSDRDCFYRYIAFLLGDDSILSTIEINDIAGEDSSNARWQSYHIPALYEKMLYTAATNPQKFRGIEYLMKTISEDGIIPEEFKNLYAKFVRVVKING